jgi:hypothetical protein
MRAAQIEDGVVVNFAEVNAFDGHRFVDPADSNVGHLWDGEKFTPPPPVLPTEAEFLVAVDGMLAEGAARRNYDSIHTAALRAGYPGPFHDEGVTYATWMDSVYSTCYTLLGKVRAGQMVCPATTADLLGLLPQCPINAGPAGA